MHVYVGVVYYCTLYIYRPKEGALSVIKGALEFSPSYNENTAYLMLSTQARVSE